MLFAIAIAASLSAAQTEPATVVPPASQDSPASTTPAETEEAQKSELTYEAMVTAAAEAAADGVPHDDSADHVRAMQRADRDDRRFFNRPGATRDEYEREWRQCRQIARRLASSRSGGAWETAGFVHGGLVGGLIFGGLDRMISERRARHDIRRQCLIVRGWRMVEPDQAGRRRISAMSEEEREIWFDRMLGAEQIDVGGEVTDRQALARSGLKQDESDTASEEGTGGE